jgi:hypothetical protein
MEYFMSKYLIGLMTVLSMLVFSGEGTAETLKHSVSVKTINRTLAGQFPVSKSFQGPQVVFSEPKAIINALDKTLKLQMMITSTNANEVLLVKATFDGNMIFDNFSESYLFEDLVLDKFKIETDSFEDSMPIIKAIKQSLINNFEDIVLVNLEQFSSELPNRQAEEIDISLKQISFIWKL